MTKSENKENLLIILIHLSGAILAILSIMFKDLTFLFYLVPLPALISYFKSISVEVENNSKVAANFQLNIILLQAVLYFIVPVIMFFVTLPVLSNFSNRNILFWLIPVFAFIINFLLPGICIIFSFCASVYASKKLKYNYPTIFKFLK